MSDAARRETAVNIWPQWFPDWLTKHFDVNRIEVTRQGWGHPLAFLLWREPFADEVEPEPLTEEPKESER